MFLAIQRMRNANFVNKYTDFGTPSISMERFNIETSYLVYIRHNKYLPSDDKLPTKWAWSGSRDPILKLWDPL